MDILGGHLLHDQATRQLFAGPYLQDEDTKTPSKERGGPFDPNSFSDDLAPPKMPPTKPTPRGIERPDVPLLGAPQSLQIRPQPPIPGLEVPGAAVPGENGRPPMAPPFLAHRSLSRSEDETEIGAGEGIGCKGREDIRRATRRHFSWTTNTELGGPALFSSAFP